MDTTALYDARIELLDFAIDAFGNVPSAEFLSEVRAGVTVPDDEVSPSLDAGFDALERFVQENADRPVDDLQDELTDRKSVV